MEIASLQNAKVKTWSRLLERKGRDQLGQFLVEGTHLVLEALRSGAEVETVAYSSERGIPDELSELRTSPAGEAAEWVSVSEAVLAKCTDAQTPQAVFAVVRKPRWRLELLWGGAGADAGDGVGTSGTGEGEERASGRRDGVAGAGTSINGVGPGGGVEVEKRADWRHEGGAGARAGADV
ncbi:RNA methyltransferase substrate-binding domain-containing protein, partial [Paenibacillus koleovorans]|uniref:RNA methyltransferase substrate-binding domain-containing protein n=1 Tax=Paenibacillus koleovorans TaxID=121608 RepID=UPI002482BAF8